MKLKKLFFILISLPITIYPQMQHNFWYQIGPFGGEVTDISLSKNSGEIAVVTQAGASAFNYDWLDVVNGEGISNVEYHPTPGYSLLLATRNNQLLSTDDNGYHWHTVLSTKDSLRGLAANEVSPFSIFLWSDSTIYRGSSNLTSWDSLHPSIGKMLTIQSHPVDSQTIYLGSMNGLFKSTDNGNSWSSISQITKPINSIAIAEVFPRIIYASNKHDNFIFMSSDNGVSWNAGNTGLPDTPINSINGIACSPTVNGLAFTATNDGIYKTVNAGTVWFKFSNQLSFLDSGIIKTLQANIVRIRENDVYTGTGEGLYHANILTDQWLQIGPYNQVVQCITKNAWSFENNIFIGTPKGVKYQNPYEWNASNLYSKAGPTITKLIASHDYYDQFLLAAGKVNDENSVIYRSTDSGVNWDSVFVLTDDSSYIEAFYQRLDSSNVVYSLVNNYNNSYGMYKSELSGLGDTWFPIEASYRKNFISVTSNGFYDSLFFLINNNQLYLSTDGGLSITYLSTIPGDKFNHLLVSNRTNIDPIYAAGNGVKRSFNYLTWENFGLDTLEVIELTEDWSSLFAATRYNGIFSNYYYSGEWYPFNNGLATKEITDIVNFTHSIMHVATANNSVYIIYSIINETNDETSNLPESFELYQNYPNPFNPTTSIQYAVGSQQFVTLKVYDLLGNEVATLVNEVREPGFYEVAYDASKLSSGVYFYVLKSGGFVETKKMILLR